MNEIKAAIEMPMFSRYGKTQAAFVNVVIPDPRKPPRRPQPKEELSKALVQVTKELDEQAQAQRSKTEPLSAVFLSVSRQQREHIMKPTNVETPAPNQYFPSERLIRPRTASDYRIRPSTTVPKPKQLTLGSCVSDDTLLCKYVRKAFDGKPITARQKSQTMKAVPLAEYELAATDRVQQLKDAHPVLSSAPGPSLDFSKQTPRRDATERTVSEARFTTFNYFPEHYSGSRRISSTYFNKTTDRKDMFIANQIDEMYDYDIEKFKKRVDMGLLDFGKTSPRSSKPIESGPESPDFQKLLKAYKRSLPRTHIASVHIGKQTSRPGTAKTIQTQYSPRSAPTTASFGSRTLKSARSKLMTAGDDRQPLSAEFRDVFSRNTGD